MQKQQLKKLYRTLLIIPLLICFLSAFSPTVSAQSTLDDGLVGYWNFDEGTGTTAIDNSGFNFDGEIDGPTYTQGVYGYGLMFDGIDDHIDFSGLAINSINDYSMSMWINITSLSEVENTIFSYFKDWNNYYFVFISNSGDIVTRSLANSNEISITSQTNIEENDLIHIAVIYNGTGFTTYLNSGFIDYNVIDRSFEDASGTSLTPLTFGLFQGFAPIPLSILDELRFYNTAKTTSEIIEIYEYDPDYVEPTPTPTPETDTFSINYLNSFALIILALICIFLTIKPTVPILNFIFGVIVLGISAATAGQSDMLLFGYLPILTVILAIVCMLSGYSNWKR